SQSLAVGNTFSVDVILNVGAHQSRGAQAGLTFDPAVIHLTSVTEGSFYKDWATANGAGTLFISPVIDNVGGTVSVAGDAIVGGPNQGPSGSGTLFTITGQAVGNGASPLSLNTVVVSGLNGRSFGSVGVTPGNVVVGANNATPTP